MNTTITEYQSKDLHAVVRLNRTITDRWHHYTLIGGDLVKGEEDSVERLSNFEQWIHGGPWNNIEMFKLYQKLVEGCQGKIFLAWNEHNELVGEIDCCIADNYDNRGYILWILTHPDYRKQGIGRQLIAYCVSFFKKRAITSLVVIPEDKNAATFYQDVGFIPHEKRIQLEISTKNCLPWKKVIKSYPVIPIFSYELERNELLTLYPLIGSTESNNYIIQTALSREEIIDILGHNIVNSQFLSGLWRLKQGDLVAIFGNVYQLRVWVNQKALKDEKFINKLQICVKSLHTHMEPSRPLNFFIMENDLKRFHNWDYIILKEEEVLLMNAHT